MRLLFLTILAVSAVVRYGSCSPNKKLSSQSVLGRALLRRALAAMSNSPRIHVNRRSLDEEEDSGDDIKHTDAVEDIFVGSGSRSEERGDSAGTKRSEVNEDQSSGSEEQSADSENSAESSGDDGTQTDEQIQGQATKGDTVEASGQEETEKTEDQQEDNSVSSGSDTVEAASETQTASPASGSSETSPSDDEQSGNESDQESESNSDKTSPAETTVQVAKSDNQTEQVSKKIASDKEVKKSTIAKVQPSLVTVNEDAETSASSGESDEVTSDTETTSGESSGAEDDGSAEAIRKGMESLSKLLKPVANGLDFQLFSGAAKPEDEEEEEDEEDKPVSKAESKGESDKAEEIQEEKPRVVKVKKCETKCALPMTYDQCAVPRCEYKMGTIKDLCIYLCKNQKPVCKQECKVVE